MDTFSLLFALGLAAAFAVPGTLAARESLEATTVPTSTTEQDEIVNKHNSLRRSVNPTASNMLKMNWDSKAAANAQSWANTCSMRHSPESSRQSSSGVCGENLYMASFKNSWSNAIQAWYNEVKNWQYGVGSINGEVVGHFTQVVWHRSHQIGCAMAFCPNSFFKYFYVCHYCPPGNLQYSHPYKSGTPCADCPNDCDNKLCTNPCPYIDQYSNCPELKKQHGCNNAQVDSWCPATCKCINKIV